MTLKEWSDARDTINEALEKCDQFSDYVDKDREARVGVRQIEGFIASAKVLAQKLLDKAEGWADLERARRYPHPTKREKSEHNEE